MIAHLHRLINGNCMNILTIKKSRLINKDGKNFICRKERYILSAAERFCKRDG